MVFAEKYPPGTWVYSQSFEHISKHPSPCSFHIPQLNLCLQQCWICWLSLLMKPSICLRWGEPDSCGSQWFFSDFHYFLADFSKSTSAIFQFSALTCPSIPSLISPYSEPTTCSSGEGSASQNTLVTPKMLPAPANHGGSTSVEQLDADDQPQTHQPIL